MSGIRSERLVELILCRLSVPTRSAPSLAKVSKSLYAYFALALTPREWDEVFTKAVSSAQRTGMVQSTKLALTTEGKAAVRRIVGSEPRSTKWKQFERNELLGVLAGIEARGADPVSAVLARRLNCAPGQTVTKTVDGWLAARLGIASGKITLDGLRGALLAQELKVPRRPKLSDVASLGAAQLADSQGGRPEQILSALILKHVKSSPKKPKTKIGRSNGANALPKATATAATPPRFAERVLKAASSREARRFGTSKAFIGSVWERLRRDADMAKLGREGFAACLTDAHRRGALVLSRADLVSAMNPADVQSSEISNLGATYHFINVGGS